MVMPETSVPKDGESCPVFCLGTFGKARTNVRPRPRPRHPPWCGEVTRVEPRSGIRSEQHTPPGTCYSRTTGVNIGSSVKTRPSITFNSVNARNQSRPQSCYGRGLPTHLNHVSEQVIWCNGLDLSWPSTGPNGQVRLARLSWNPA